MKGFWNQIWSQKLEEDTPSQPAVSPDFSKPSGDPESVITNPILLDIYHKM
jgi:hypothetical protein